MSIVFLKIFQKVLGHLNKCSVYIIPAKKCVKVLCQPVSGPNERSGCSPWVIVYIGWNSVILHHWNTRMKISSIYFYLFTLIYNKSCVPLFIRHCRPWLRCYVNPWFPALKRAKENVVIISRIHFEYLFGLAFSAM